MARKETTSLKDFMTIVTLLEEARIPYWIDGGWGIDLLVGRQTRMHRDIDIDFDAQYTEQLMALLTDYGYKTDTDQAPIRIELYSDDLGYLDIHPFLLGQDGTAKQGNPEGGYYEFESDYFGSAVFEGKTIPCISVKGQKIFHTGYELREKDEHDLQLLQKLER